MEFIKNSAPFKYSYNFNWFGRPVIQFPQDIVALQELVYEVKPDLIIETGIAHGGSLVLSASLLALLDIAHPLPDSRKRKVLGVDIDIRPHNDAAIKSHPLADWMESFVGSSVDVNTIDFVRNFASNYKEVMVLLDSNHTEEHVLAELRAYAPLVTVNSYCIVSDTIVEDLPKSLYPNRDWGPGNNPKTAVWKYLKENPSFEIQKDIENKLLVTSAPDGYLKRIY